MGTELFNIDQNINDNSTNNRLIIKDEVNQKGLVYQDDYSANFTTYSLVTKGYVDSKPYKIYSALLSQSGALSPTAIELENTLGITATFSYMGPGYYELHMSGKFTSGKTFIINGWPDQYAIGGDFGILITTYFNSSILV